eukprot:TRINITY_DN65686_c9_g6_i1.p1 TRINITY_DN65686_c9_g6~~TRINITY_DN65686_c9_g6_i1.p1  ORF type:complete len:782 (-),score=475.77 TRINITY_DN65686_c9_g6_i1:266-2611(-)
MRSVVVVLLLAIVAVGGAAAMSQEVENMVQDLLQAKSVPHPFSPEHEFEKRLGKMLSFALPATPLVTDEEFEKMNQKSLAGFSSFVQEALNIEESKEAAREDSNCKKGHKCPIVGGVCCKSGDVCCPSLNPCSDGDAPHTCQESPEMKLLKYKTQHEARVKKFESDLETIRGKREQKVKAHDQNVSEGRNKVLDARRKAEAEREKAQRAEAAEKDKARAALEATKKQEGAEKRKKAAAHAAAEQKKKDEEKGKQAQERKKKAAIKAQERAKKDKIRQAERSKKNEVRAKAEQKRKHAKQHWRIVPGTFRPRKGRVLTNGNRFKNNGAHYSYMFWVKPMQRAPWWQNILHKGGRNNQRDPAIWIIPRSSRLHVRVGSARSWNDGINTRAISIGQWTHIAVVATDRVLRIYMDGNQVHARGFRGLRRNKGPLYTSDPWHRAMNGYIGDLRYLSYAASPQEVRKVYQSQKAAHAFQRQSMRLIGGNFNVRKGRVIAHGNRFKRGANQYAYTFWLRPYRIQHAWGNILHKGRINQHRNPGIWLFPHSTRMHIRVGTRGSWNAGVNPRPVPMKRWTHVAVTVAGNHLTVYYNARVVARANLPGGAVAQNGEQLWASDPWHRNAFATIRDLRYFNYNINPNVVRSIFNQQRGLVKQRPRLPGRFLRSGLNNGWCLMVDRAHYRQRLRIAPCRNDVRYRWIRNGRLIRSAQNRAFCIDSPRHGNHGRLHMWRCNHHNRNQQWHFSHNRITLRRTRQSIDIPHARLGNRKQVHMWRSHGGRNQKWYYRN